MRKRNALLFSCLGIVWLVLDIASKRAMEATGVGLWEDASGPIMGLFKLTLVHNSGGAWSIFSNSTVALGVFSLLVCIGLSLYLLVFCPNSNLLQALGITLVVAGGIGNVIDRFAFGYVVDFINLTFMHFPVFNIADIGVTCGFVLFLIGLFVEFRNDSTQKAGSR